MDGTLENINSVAGLISLALTLLLGQTQLKKQSAKAKDGLLSFLAKARDGYNRHIDRCVRYPSYFAAVILKRFCIIIIISIPYMPDMPKQILEVLIQSLGIDITRTIWIAYNYLLGIYLGYAVAMVLNESSDVLVRIKNNVVSE